MTILLVLFFTLYIYFSVLSLPRFGFFIRVVLDDWGTLKRRARSRYAGTVIRKRFKYRMSFFKKASHIQNPSSRMGSFEIYAHFFGQPPGLLDDGMHARLNQIRSHFAQKRELNALNEFCLFLSNTVYY